MGSTLTCFQSLFLVFLRPFFNDLLIITSPNAMVMEGDETLITGWPLGLGSMTVRIRVADAAQTAAPPQPRPSRIRRSSSFSSFSSSNLDTESTASFFPDQSVSLGRLIGIKPANKGRTLYCERGRNTVSVEERPEPISGVIKSHESSDQGLCVPLLHHVIGKMSRNGSTSRSR